MTPDGYIQILEDIHKGGGAFATCKDGHEECAAWDKGPCSIDAQYALVQDEKTPLVTAVGLFEAFACIVYVIGKAALFAVGVLWALIGLEKLLSSSGGQGIGLRIR